MYQQKRREDIATALDLLEKVTAKLQPHRLPSIKLEEVQRIEARLKEAKDAVAELENSLVDSSLQVAREDRSLASHRQPQRNSRRLSAAGGYAY
jgi:hypothetical protein